MKTTTLSLLTLIFCFAVLSCGDSNHDAVDNRALFDSIQRDLGVQQASLDEYMERMDNPDGLPFYFREFADLTYDEFVAMYPQKSEQEITDQLQRIRKKLDENLNSQ
ncbi:MAG: hypothetical protein KDC12_09825 [Flavobacteriales bacterium]|nr:hypothetical protein [Flavobacteriales bacterium]